MNIEIVKPYQNSEQRIITFDNITITLDGKEMYILLETLDNELNYGYTREDLENKIEDLESELEAEKELQKMSDQDRKVLSEFQI